MANHPDALDKQIVDLLSQDGRLSSSEIARMINTKNESNIGQSGERVNERLIRYRIERLIRSGVISVSAVVDPRKIGFPVAADVFIEVEAGQVRELAEQIAKYENVTYVACSTGNRDISIQVVATDNRSLYNFVTEVIGRIPGVRRTTTSLVPLIVKDDAHWTIPASVIKKE